MTSFHKAARQQKEKSQGKARDARLKVKEALDSAKDAPKYTGRIKAFSVSRLKQHDNCPRKTFYSHVKRIREPAGAPAARGSRIHSDVEAFLKAKSAPKSVPKATIEVSGPLRGLRKLGAISEQKWCFDVRWREVPWNSKKAWVRMILDAHYFLDDGPGGTTTCHIVDFKTGKVRDEHLHDMKLYAAGAFARYTHVQHVTVDLWYLDHAGPLPGECLRVGGASHPQGYYSRDELWTLQAYWWNRARALLDDTSFDPTPNPLCGWCYFNKDNGGPCVGADRGMSPRAELPRFSK